MLAEQGDGAASVRIPDTVQALIAARIDRLPPASRSVVRHGALVGRVFWRGAVAELDPAARRRHRARRSRRPPAAHARAALDRLGRGRVPLPPRADPRRRVQRPRQGRAGTAAPDVRRVAPVAVDGRARRGAGLSPRACRGAPRGARGAGARRPAGGGGGRARASGLPRTGARGEPHRAPAAAPLDRARAQPRAAVPRRARRLAALGAACRVGRDGGRPRPSRRRPASARSRASRSPSWRRSS